MVAGQIFWKEPEKQNYSVAHLVGVEFEPHQGMAISRLYLTDYINQPWFVVVVADSVAHNAHPQRAAS